MSRNRAFVVLLGVALAGCTTASAPTATSSPPTPSPSIASSPSLSASSSSKPPAFSAARALADVKRLVANGSRESVSASYRRAGSFVERRFESLGFRVQRQHFDLPAGRSDGIAVKAGRTFNVVATTQGLRAGEARIVVGAHLDSVPDSPGANDNASGVAAMLELARLAASTPLKVPIVFVAFSGEERRRQGPGESVFAAGSKHYVTALSTAAKAAIVGMVNVDMVGSGRLRVMGEESSMTRLAMKAAASIDVSARRDTTFSYSDHVSFDVAGIPTAWLWTGDDDRIHSPRDVYRIVRTRSLRATGRVAWATLRKARA